MPRMGIKAKNQKALELIEKTIEDTEIIQRQKSLMIGRWDFVVFGCGKKNEIVIRKGYAEQSTIQRTPVYIASLGQPGQNEGHGIPIEELIEEDLPEEYLGLEIYQISPLRPFVIEEKRKEEGGIKSFDMIAREYESDNIAVIQTPKEGDWPIAVLKYLNLCDQDFPDMALKAFNTKNGFMKGISGSSSNFIN
jgi:hypothetical protein